MPKILQTPPGVHSSSRYFIEASLDSMVIMYCLIFSPTHCADDTMKVGHSTTRSHKLRPRERSVDDKKCGMEVVGVGS